MATINVHVEVWSSLSHLFGEQRLRSRSLEKRIPAGTTLDRFLRDLAEEYVEFGRFFYKPGTKDPSGRVSVIVNNRLPELLKGDQTELHDNDRIVLVQAYEGG